MIQGRRHLEPVRGEDILTDAFQRAFEFAEVWHGGGEERVGSQSVKGQGVDE
ncbi:MAG: hypothetical protein KatS3mg131_3623 [Candidatus Tectimicrobiota bacterium]|nr:MAG: hypothetical protein KatS3mg131_3623 [Candidatus Tectomicrobia bacterium]